MFIALGWTTGAEILITGIYQPKAIDMDELMERNVSLEDTRKVWIYMGRYEVVYFGAFFSDDKDGKYNSYPARDWNDAYGFWFMIKDDFSGCYIKDNDEDVIFEDGEWY